MSNSSISESLPEDRKHLSSQDRWIKLAKLILVCASIFMLPLDYTIVAVALHDIQLDLKASFVDLQWVVNGYTLTFAAFLLAGGTLADLFGRRRLYISGMVVFMLSSLACGLAPIALFLNLARSVQGVGAAIMLAAALPLLVREFEGPERARAFGIFGAAVGIGAALGPFLGGVLVGALGWRWAFLVNVPVTAVIIALTLWRVRESKDPNAGGVDWGGLISFTAACFLLVYALIAGNDLGWDSPTILGLFAATVVLLIAFVAVEIGRRYPMFDLTLFRNATFIGASIPPLTLSIAFWGVFLYFPLFYQAVLGYTPLQAGVAVLPFAIPLFVMGPVGGWLATRISSRLLLAIGQGLVAIGSLMLLRGAAVGASWSAYVLGGLISGTGAGLINGEMTNVAISIVPEGAPMASGINTRCGRLASRWALLAWGRSWPIAPDKLSCWRRTVSAFPRISSRSCWSVSSRAISPAPPPRCRARCNRRSRLPPTPACSRAFASSFSWPGWSALSAPFSRTHLSARQGDRAKQNAPTSARRTELTPPADLFSDVPAEGVPETSGKQIFGVPQCA